MNHHVVPFITPWNSYYNAIWKTMAAGQMLKVNMHYWNSLIKLTNNDN